MGNIYLTNRQKQILFAVVDIYSRSADNISSRLLAELLTWSSATIRVELTILESLGLIHHPHSSSGVIPTETGYRYYVNNVLLLNEHSKAIELISSKIQREQVIGSAIRQATEFLSDINDSFVFSIYQRNVNYIGLSKLFAHPEFSDQDQVVVASRYIDEIFSWLSSQKNSNSLNIFIGYENPVVKSSGLTIVYSKISVGDDENNYIGCVGPTRQDYLKIISNTKKIAKSLQEIIN